MAIKEKTNDIAALKWALIVPLSPVLFLLASEWGGLNKYFCMILAFIAILASFFMLFKTMMSQKVSGYKIFRLAKFADGEKEKIEEINELLGKEKNQTMNAGGLIERFRKSYLIKYPEHKKIDWISLIYPVSLIAFLVAFVFGPSIGINIHPFFIPWVFVVLFAIGFFGARYGSRKATDIEKEYLLHLSKDSKQALEVAEETTSKERCSLYDLRKAEKKIRVLIEDDFYLTKAKVLLEPTESNEDNQNS